MTDSPRITYWTGWLSPEMEGCSKEVFALKDHFPRSRIFGLSRFYRVKASRTDRYFGLNVRLYPLFRALAPFWDATSDINHVYGSLSEWFFLRALKRRPVIMTIATAANPLPLDLYRHVTRVVAHSAATARKLVRFGFDPATVVTIYPGVDLSQFTPAPRPARFPGADASTDPARFRILFATTPGWSDGVRTRGVDLLIEAARRLPDVDFYLPWRPWAGARPLIDECRRRAPANVHISTERVTSMSALFQAADATTAPFVTKAAMKLCPTSLIESLGCGRPLLVSTRVGIADVVRTDRCGVVFAPTVDAFCRAVARLRSGYDQYAGNARPAAERHFDLRQCLDRHEQLYAEVLRAC